MSDIQFICGKENKDFAEFLSGHKQAIEEKNNEMEFLKKRAEAIKDNWEQRWKALFIKLQESGAIGKNISFDEWDMTINEELGQLFLVIPQDNMMPKINIVKMEL